MSITDRQIMRLVGENARLELANTLLEQIRAQLLEDLNAARLLIEIRRQEGAIDEVVARGHVHLEQMDRGSWSLIIDDGERTTYLRLCSRGKIECWVDFDGDPPEGEE